MHIIHFHQFNRLIHILYIEVSGTHEELSHKISKYDCNIYVHPLLLDNREIVCIVLLTRIHTDKAKNCNIALKIFVFVRYTDIDTVRYIRCQIL